LAGLDLNPGLWVGIVLLGALVGLDGISWSQLMISRPIVAGTLGGLLFGDPGAGFLSGALLEIVSARHPPYGAARYPETGPAGLIAGAAYASVGSAGLLPLITVTLAGWAIGWTGSHSIQLQRALNGHLVGDPTAFGGDARMLTRRHRLAMRLDAVRAAFITAVFVVPTMVAANFAASFAPPTHARLSGALAAAGIAGLAGAGARVLGGRPRGWSAFAGGALAGAALGVLLT
jgi:mannose/fructose/N-acetylgalactosamine-specific phosphotransferase system component IIC